MYRPDKLIELLEYAKERVKECKQHGGANTAHYWEGYRDALRAAYHKFEGRDCE